ncbi:MAG: bifunctional homocysteine S-methyltransferase/methylenetetrahydrofolate reductase [Sulfobacillus thermosulfidooxidans]|uniref:bifunctional homocysteine S-methyltransferase/methylenetetrahydrofolate reductase n=1 Tax=Sulfobacillus TaxID=28033 RepID=UPI000CD2E179|nr:bifunctional homocysteine S-methyltransferase/methylenetetrahydrofolate reductase [Sulfobacillus sp. hq2]POB09146.1 bifunctional homocysteine S-methyltransferase/methylenetetrahydrofolate reductase [Sulfobacillus sp. hq2]PSR36998.1 MAG: bifunctional homocysteine S-methyltransferase/methylenetetrahydrofolate reductase [Sulfobacillus thermosulfidooxidans]
MKSLADALRDPTWIIGDGASGTALMAAGIDPAALPLVPLRQPDTLMNLHLQYLEAGARLLETQTFSANGSKLAALGLEADVVLLHRRAAQIARHARDIFGEPAWIVGSIGPLAQPVASPVMESLTHEEAVDYYRPVVAGLLAGGVDGFIVETMSDIPTVLAAVEAIREESLLPIIVSFAFSPEGATRYGLTPEQAIEAMGQLPGGPPQLVGANCGSGPAPLLDAVIRMAPRAKDLQIPLAAFPNAGQPAMVANHVHYPASPHYVATMAPALAEAGCRVIGGCCGTTAAHIQAIAQTLQHMPVLPQVRTWNVEDEHAANETMGGEGAPEGIRQLFGKRFVVSVELDPPRGVNPHRVLEAARTVWEAGADAINIGDSPMARVRLSALATARLIAEQLPVETILHFTTRDRNLMGLQSDLLGAHALGIRNVLALTGDPPGIGDYAHATAVYDINSIGLVKVLAGFNQGQDASGQKIGGHTAFDIGVGVNPTAEDLDHEVLRLQQKLEAGAGFIMSQPIYAKEQLERFLDRFGPLPVPLLLGVMPLVSYRQALYLHNEVPGITIGTEILAQFEHVQDGTALGIDMACALLDDLESVIQGVYLVPSFNRVEPLLPLIAYIRQEFSTKKRS